MNTTQNLNNKNKYDFSPKYHQMLQKMQLEQLAENEQHQQSSQPQHISRGEKLEFVNEIYPKMCNQFGFDYMPAIMPSVRRLVVFGDIHGDYKLFIDMLHIASVAEVNKTTGKLIWIGGDTHVVQVGDQIDRCRPMGAMQCTNPATTLNDEASDIKIMMLSNELHLQAKLVGGAFISLLGNHEIMNATGAMTYVSHLGLREFENYVDPKHPNKKFNSGMEARIHAFKPGNELGVMMGCTRLPAVIIGSHLLVHAGIVDGLIEQLGLSSTEDLESINISMRKWLLGLIKRKNIKNIIKSSRTSMFWTRILGNIPPGTPLSNPACSDHIGKVLSLFKIGSIIIGHTPQSFSYSDDINQTCSNKVWRVDNGSSSAFHKFDRDMLTTGKPKHSRRPQVLEILNDTKYSILDGIRCKEIF